MGLSPEDVATVREQFASFNHYGGDVSLVDPPPDDLPLRLGLADSFEIVRTAPHAGTAASDIWVLWREAGYLNVFQVHLLRVVESWFADDTLFLRDDSG